MLIKLAIIKQCLKCKDIGKKMYCKDCEKSIDYFEIFENMYENNNNTNIPTLIHTIKAYTWNDVIIFIKDKYFKEQKDLVIDCEKDFAYLERQPKLGHPLANPVDQSRSYKIYLKNKNNLDPLENTSIPKMLVDLTTHN